MIYYMAIILAFIGVAIFSRDIQTLGVRLFLSLKIEFKKPVINDFIAIVLITPIIAESIELILLFGTGINGLFLYVLIYDIMYFFKEKKQVSSLSKTLNIHWFAYVLQIIIFDFTSAICYSRRFILLGLIVAILCNTFILLYSFIFGYITGRKQGKQDAKNGIDRRW